MRKNKLVSVVLMVIISLSLVFVAKDVFAADTTTDLTSTLGNKTTNNTAVQSISSDKSTSSSKNNTVKNSTVLTTNNTTSTYNNTTLPKTGLESSVPMVIIAVVLGISAVYAYKKVQYYKNI